MSTSTPIGNIVIGDRNQLRAFLKDNNASHYTYVLRQPDGVICHGGIGTPFYVGIGQGARLFAHIEDARLPEKCGRKVEVIRSIWKQGLEIIHCIDAFHNKEPWDREEFLIRTIGQIKHGTGTLTNEQDYAPSHKILGIEVRKYRGEQSSDPDAIPLKFKYANVRLAAGPREPKTRQSVFGKIYTALERNPGVTGIELVALLKLSDFSDNKSAYTQSGKVCATWLCRYIEGGFRKDRQHICCHDTSGRRE